MKQAVSDNRERWLLGTKLYKSYSNGIFNKEGEIKIPKNFLSADKIKNKDKKPQAPKLAGHILGELESSLCMVYN